MPRSRCFQFKKWGSQFRSLAIFEDQESITRKAPGALQRRLSRASPQEAARQRPSRSFRRRPAKQAQRMRGCARKAMPERRRVSEATVSTRCVVGNEVDG